jgi:hypothetical protein
LETFGSTEGIALDVPEFPLEGAVLTSMVSRGRIFFLGLDIHAQAVKSVAIDITKKVTEFMFKAKGNKHVSKHAPYPAQLFTRLSRRGLDALPRSPSREAPHYHLTQRTAAEDADIHH